MIAHFRSTWFAINASYWFYPALFSIAGFILGLVLVQVDRSGAADWVSELSVLQAARPDGASNMLTVLAGSMIGVASTVFSITIAAVAYASGNYGPRLLTNFMEDKGNQLSLATFIGTFVYAITVLRTVRSEDEAPLFADQADALPGFVPQLSLLVAFGLLIVSVAVLVYFLHHIPASIRVNSVLEGIGKRLINDIGQQFPDEAAGQVEMQRPQGRPVNSDDVGYVQMIDFERLERIADAAGGHLKLGVRTGDFVHAGVPLSFWKDDDELDDLHDKQIRDCFTLGGMRTPSQDLHFLIDELVEIGLRALSPGINDPFTAITVNHWLGAAVSELGQRDLTRKFGGAKSADEDRLELRADDFAHFVSRSFGAMRTSLATSRAASIVAFEVMANAGLTVDDGSRRAVLQREAALLMQQARIHLKGPDLEEVAAQFEEFGAALQN